MKWKKPNRKSLCVENCVRFEFNLLPNRFWKHMHDDECSNQTCAHTHVTLKIVFRFSHSFVAFNDDDDDDDATADDGGDGGAIAFAVFLLHIFPLYISASSVLLFNI